ncbi:MAG: hypothetical protein FWH37_09810 [Candidatus Bathyarchaeota archaeon]|nr:hypothetical protein [Candidatus Termiticorpusculum sp.]
MLLLMVLFEFEITVQNVVLTGSFSEEIDLDVAVSSLVGSKHSWKRFPGLAYKLKSPSATFLLFKSGKFVCTGVKTRVKGVEAIDSFLGLLKMLGLVSGVCSFVCCVKNLVALVDIVGVSIALEQFSSEFGVVYAPDKFPAAVYRMGGFGASFLVFLSGKLICSGVSDEEDLKRVVKVFYDQLVDRGVIESVFC